MTWQPISTAPKDGTRVLCFREGWQESMSVIYWGASWGVWISAHGGHEFSGATHWQPLPPPTGGGEIDGMRL